MPGGYRGPWGGLVPGRMSFGELVQGQIGNGQASTNVVPPRLQTVDSTVWGQIESASAQVKVVRFLQELIAVA